jgi:hypothetical protein
VDVAPLPGYGVCESREGNIEVLLRQWSRLGWPDEDDWNGVQGEWIGTAADKFVSVS